MQTSSPRLGGDDDSLWFGRIYIAVDSAWIVLRHGICIDSVETSDSCFGSGCSWSLTVVALVLICGRLDYGCRVLLSRYLCPSFSASAGASWVPGFRAVVKRCQPSWGSAWSPARVCLNWQQAFSRACYCVKNGLQAVLAWFLSSLFICGWFCEIRWQLQLVSTLEWK